MSYQAPPPPPPPPGPPGSPYGPVPSTSPLAIASLVTGILGLPFLCVCGTGAVLSIAALITGVIGRNQIARSNGTLQGGGMALAGIILGGVGVVLLVLWVVLVAVGTISDHQFHTSP